MPLTFYYGTMGSSKSAHALMARVQYLEKGFAVALMKPEADTRGGKDRVVSRVGLWAPCVSIPRALDLLDWYRRQSCQVILVDEAQFLTPAQVEQLKEISLRARAVFCYGLKTDFRTRLFPGSRRLLELADQLVELPTVCRCGRKAEVSARIQDDKILRTGERVLIGGDERYVSMCYRCWSRRSALEQTPAPPKPEAPEPTGQAPPARPET